MVVHSVIISVKIVTEITLLIESAHTIVIRV